MAAGKGAATDIVKALYPEAPSFRFSDSLRKFYRALLSGLVDTGIFHAWDPDTVVDEETARMRIRPVCEAAFRLGPDVSPDAHDRFASWILDEFIPAHNGSWSENASTADLQELSTKAREHFGENILERSVLSLIAVSQTESPVVIIEGIRRTVDIAELVADASVFFRLIYIEADTLTRWMRHALRNEKPGDAELSFPAFMQLGKAEAESQIRSLRTAAHLVIDNTPSPSPLAGILSVWVREWLAQR